MSPGRTLIVASLLWFPACGDDGDDSPGVDAADVQFTGEFLTWDSVPPNSVEGVFMATLTVRGDATRTFSTPPNGRINFAIPGDPVVTFDVTPMTGSDLIGGIGVVTPAIATSGNYSIRTFTAARAADFGYQASAAQVYVHVIGTAGAVEVGAAHDAAYKFDGASWVPGNTGSDVYLPNVAPAGGMTTITVGGATGLPASIPLEAGKLTYVVAQGS